MKTGYDITKSLYERSVERRRRLKIVSIVIAAILGALLLFVGSIAACISCHAPVYHSFTKKVGSLDEIKNELDPRLAIVYPKLEELGLGDYSFTEFSLNMDGRDRSAKPIGYNIYRVIPIEPREDYHCEFSISCRKIEGWSAEDRLYEDEYEYTRVSSKQIKVDHKGYRYTFSVDYSTGRLMSMEDQLNGRQEIAELLRTIVKQVLGIE
ncbi:MAG: hypothetical protein II871_07600 [Clostridia bacterium]|nr:hypothetical protein [Clostridia bacterium]